MGATGDSGRKSGPDPLSDPARPAIWPADVYFYRDSEGLPRDSGSSAPGPDENDPSYWYDLTGTGPARSDQPGGIPREPSEIRGPFEPLVSSAGGGGDATLIPDAARPAENAPAAEGHEDAGHARQLEQLKDLDLTAEAIGEAHVDKHFDQLLAQQRELISEYFKRPPATAPPGDAPPGHAPPGHAPPGHAPPVTAAPDGPAGPAEDESGGARPAGGPAGPSEGARVAADQPRA